MENKPNFVPGIVGLILFINLATIFVLALAVGSFTVWVIIKLLQFWGVM